MSGYISLHRKIFDNHLWLSEPFTKAQAWVDLLLLANYKEGKIVVRGITITIKRGQCGWSEVKLSERWQWSRNKVRGFLATLEKEQQIEQQKNNVSALITIVNYDKYQINEQQTEQQTEQQKDSKLNSKRYTNNKDNKNNKEKKDNNNIPEQVGGVDSKVISIGDSEKQLYNQALKAFYEYYQNQYGTKYNFTAKDGSNLKQLLKKIEAKCREQELTIDNESILNAFQYFISNISDKWVLAHFTVPILNSKFNEIFINLKQNIYGTTGKLSPADEAVIRTYLKYANY